MTVWAHQARCTLGYSPLLDRKCWLLIKISRSHDIYRHCRGDITVGAQVARRLGQPIKLDLFRPCVALGEASAHGATLSRKSPCLPHGLRVLRRVSGNCISGVEAVRRWHAASAPAYDLMSRSDTAGSCYTQAARSGCSAIGSAPEPPLGAGRGSSRELAAKYKQSRYGKNNY
jgi:hypothetical protein